jgi:hypothetical protein
MSRILTITTVILTLVEVPARPEAPPAAGAVRVGMTPGEVKKILGPPRSISRVVLWRRHLEQWHYDAPVRVVEFNCVRGEAPVVSSIQIPIK